MAKVVGKAPAQDSSTGQFISLNDPKVERLVPKDGGRGRKVRVVLPVGGMSVLAIDPGKTTGVALWDAWDQCWYVDQLDVKRARLTRLKVQSGVIDGSVVVGAEDQNEFRNATGVEWKASSRRQKDLALDDILERMTTQNICDLIMAAGPRCIVVVEDFLIGTGAGDGMRGIEFGRDGLSPVRMIARIRAMVEYVGLLNGDAWRNFDCGWWTGGDNRGVSVVNNDPVGGGRLAGVPRFTSRLTRVERWRLGEVVSKRGYEAVWAGRGVQMIMRTPAQRVWMPGGLSAQKDYMRSVPIPTGSVGWNGMNNDDLEDGDFRKRKHGWWVPGLPHAMDAMMHAYAVGREVGLTDQSPPVRIWHARATANPERVTGKSVRPGQRPLL